MKNKLVIIDSFALIFRAYYAYPPTLKNKSGELTNAVYGFTSLLLDVINKLNPSHVIAVFDPQTPIIRQSEFVLYKANRKETDKELVQQIPRVKEMLEAFGIPVLKVDGYEADDVIGTVDRMHAGNWAETVVVTGDQDLFQLIDEDTFVYMAGRKFSESKLFKKEDVKAKLGIYPENVPDYKALRGDASDNIPGVKGIGPKTAEDLITKYGTLESIYENLEDIELKVRNKLQESYEIAVKSKSLATIERNVPLSFDFSQSKFGNLDLNKIFTLIKEFEFRSLEKKVQDLSNHYAEKDAPGLFDEVGTENSKNEAPIALDKFKIEEFKNVKNGAELFMFIDVDNKESACIALVPNKIIISLDSKKLFQVDKVELVNVFNLINEKKLKLIAPNIKLLLHVLLNLGVNKEQIDIRLFEDMGFALQIFTGGRYSHTLSDLYNYANISISNDSAKHIETVFEVYNKLFKDVEIEKDIKAIYELEKSIVLLVVEMERNGINLNIEKLHTIQIKLEELKRVITEELFKDVGHEFNINSPKQVGEILFSERSLPGAKKTKTGAFSTDERSLKLLSTTDPVVKNVLRFREVDKLLSTYVKALPTYLKNGKIHSEFNQMGAISGRFSSKNPNMQNIPVNTDLNANIRECFVASPNSFFIAFDYSQQELRILAALANEQIMIDSFNNNDDIHKLTASELFDKPIDQVTDSERSIGKTINFSIVYGISAFGLAERLMIDRATASLFIHKFYNKYINIKKYFDDRKNELNTIEYATTMIGRRRVNDINSVHKFAKSAVERELLNFAIQGTAADTMKLAMSQFKEGMNKYSAKLLLQIHDEFLFEYSFSDQKISTAEDLESVVKIKEVEDFIGTIKKIMEEIQDIGVSYKVDCKVGINWGAMKKLN